MKNIASTKEEVDEIKNSLEIALRLLHKKEKSLFGEYKDSLEDNEVVEYTTFDFENKLNESEKKQNRELIFEIKHIMLKKVHEVSINHKFANILWCIILNEYNLIENGYSVDIEYNRDFKNTKLLDIEENGHLSTVIPDIVVHQRTTKTKKSQTPNFLVIECKKDKIDEPLNQTCIDKWDFKKIKAFIESDFKYKFGLAVTYGNSIDECEAILGYRKSDNEIEYLRFSKKKWKPFSPQL